jgi:hypothetical protein
MAGVSVIVTGNNSALVQPTPAEDLIGIDAVRPSNSCYGCLRPEALLNDASLLRDRVSATLGLRGRFRRGWLDRDSR